MDDPSSRATKRDRLSVVEAEILELDSRLATLHQERSSLKNDLAAYKYPVLSLPNEVTSEIFLCWRDICIYDTEDEAEWNLLGPASPSWLFRVCRHWREIALRTPQLWAHIVCSERTEEMTDGRSNAIFAAWLARSGSCPLTFDLPLSDFPASLPIISAERSRWQKIAFHIDVETQTQLISGPAPVLLQLHLVASRRNGPLPLLHISHAPSLRAVCLWNVRWGPLSVPWIQLNTLSLVSTPLNDCTAVLPLAVNLIRLKIVLRRQEDGMSSIPSILLPVLQTFVVAAADVDGDGMIGECLLRLRVPAIRRFRVHHSALTTTRATSIASQIGALIKRSRTDVDCRLELERVQICGGFDEEFDDTPWLEAMQSACRDSCLKLPTPVTLSRLQDGPELLFEDELWQQEDDWIAREDEEQGSFRFIIGGPSASPEA